MFVCVYERERERERENQTRRRQDQCWPRTHILEAFHLLPSSIPRALLDFYVEVSQVTPLHS